MALYGPFTPAGYIPFTGFTPTLGASDAVVQTTSGQVQMNGMTQDDYRIARALRRPPNRVFRRLILTLLGTVAGSTATETRTRVQANQVMNLANQQGGLITIETVNLINRATTSTDTTNITAMINRVSGPASYPADLSGNGGGGRLGF